MADVQIIDVDVDVKEEVEQQHCPKVPKTDDSGRSRTTGIRKKRAASLSLLRNLTAGEKEARVEELEKELNGLFGYYRELKDKKVIVELSTCGTRNAMIAVLMEESEHNLSALVDEICERLRSAAAVGMEPVTHALVKSYVVSNGKRIAYGVPNAEADVLEDNSESCFWCWETRDLKLIPKYARGHFIVRRMCRERISERIVAVSEMISSLKKPENEQNYHHGLIKASTMLSEAYNEADIRILVCGLVQKISVDMDQRKAKREEKLLLEQLDTIRREVQEKDSTMLRGDSGEASKEDACVVTPDVSENKKQKFIQPVETERERRHREKKESELKNKLSLQRQALFMERFLKRSKPEHSSQNDQLSSNSLNKTTENMCQFATQSMDSTLASCSETTLGDICKTHFSLWRDLGKSIRSKKNQRWGVRTKPKSEVVKKLKLASTTRGGRYGELTAERHGERLGRHSYDADNYRLHVRKRCYRKQLLQFHNSPRPPFYGIWSNNKSRVVGPRHPFRKEPSLDYDFNSADEWEEEHPGDRISDFEDDEEESEQECSNFDYDTTDGFVVPNDYLSEDESANVDKMKTAIVNAPGDYDDVENEEFYVLLRRQKYVNSLTEEALKRNHPLIITNLMHGKELGQNLTGTLQMEQKCLQSLSMRLISGSSDKEISVHRFKEVDHDVGLSADKGKAALVSDVNAMLDQNLSTLVATIEAFPLAINKVLKSLQQMFPSASKSLLRDKVREISDYVDEKLQVKKEVLVKLGMVLSHDTGCLASGSTATPFSGSCMLPGETSHSSSQ